MIKLFKKLLFVLLLAISTVTIVGCKEPGKVDPPKPDPDVTISIGEAAGTIKKGETVKLTVEITGTEDKTFTWKISDETILAIDGENNVTVIKDVVVDKIVTVTATANADTTKTASKTFKVLAPVIEGQVGELTSDMLKEISNSSITVTGVLTDYYTDFNQASNNTINEYQMSVKMNENKWVGEWNSSEMPNNKVKSFYQIGSKDGIIDGNGNIGHNLEKVFINKNNKAESKTVVDTMGFPAVWEAQHLWNHLGNLQISKFVYDAANEVYEYKIDETNMDDLYLMTYLSFSLTPLLFDTLLKFYLVVEDGEITGIKGQTEIIYYGADDQDDPDAMSYTTIDLIISDINATEIVNPEPYKNPENADALQKALDKMSTATNYTFQTVDTLLYSPSSNPDEYVPQTSSMNANRTRAKANVRSKVHDSISSVGTVGCFGKITKDATLYAITDKYQYAMDGKNYYTNHSGYVQNTDGTYDLYKFDSDTMGMVGQKKIKGNFIDALPKFNFSPALFEFVGASMRGDKTLYTFELMENEITRDIAMQMSDYKYADDGCESTYKKTSIVVDSDGNLISTTFPYSFGEGTYMGYCKTTYKDFGTTKLEDGLFDNYVPRKAMTSWEDYITKYYSPNFTTPTHEEQTLIVLEATYGKDMKDIPSPELFVNIIGDNIHGPFYDWKSRGKDENGKEKYFGYVSLKVTCPDQDENGRIRDYNGLMDQFKDALTAEGFTISKANTDMSGGANGRLNRYVCFIKNNIQIVIEDNHTKFLDIYFYKTGDWTLK